MARRLTARQLWLYRWWLLRRRGCGCNTCCGCCAGLHGTGCGGPTVLSSALAAAAGPDKGPGCCSPIAVAPKRQVLAEFGQRSLTGAGLKFGVPHRTCGGSNLSGGFLRQQPPKHSSPRPRLSSHRKFVRALAHLRSVPDLASTVCRVRSGLAFLSGCVGVCGPDPGPSIPVCCPVPRRCAAQHLPQGPSLNDAGRIAYVPRQARERALSAQGCAGRATGSRGRNRTSPAHPKQQKHWI